MTTLQTIRQAPRLMRAVLAWFVLSVGVAVAAPVVQPQSLSLVCSAAGGMKLVGSAGQGDQGTPVVGHHTLDCVLCLALGVPPAETLPPAATAPLSTAVVPDWASAHMAWRTAAPLPARGPPVQA